MGNAEQIVIEVCYARPERQELVELQLKPGTTLMQAIEDSGVLKRFPEINLANNKVGVFGKLASLNHVLHDGDRVEIYRPLIADPREVRRLRAGRCT